MYLLPFCVYVFLTEFYSHLIPSHVANFFNANYSAMLSGLILLSKQSVCLTSITCSSHNSPCRRDQRHLPGTKFSTFRIVHTCIPKIEAKARHSSAVHIWLISAMRACVIPLNFLFPAVNPELCCASSTSTAHAYKWVRVFFITLQFGAHAARCHNV